MSGFSIVRTYPHPPALVWRALTTPELLARWLMPNDFAPVVGHEFTFTTEPGPGFDGVVRCRVTEIEAPSTLAFTWVGGPIDTVVRFEIEAAGEGTRLTMTQSGFTGVRARLVGQMLRIGSKTVYGKRLPRLLDELAGVSPPGEDGEGCMSPSQGGIRRALHVLERLKR